MGLSPARFLGFLFSFSFSFVLSAAPQLRLSQTAVGPLTLATGANTAGPTIEASNVGDGALNLRVSSSAQWLAPSLGVPRDCTMFNRGCIPIEIALRTSSLQQGTYTGVITVADPNAVDAPQTVTVTVQIGGAVPDRADLYVAPNGSSSESRFYTSSALRSSTTTQSGGDWLAVASDATGSFRYGVMAPYRIVGRPAAGTAEGAYNGQVVFSGSAIPSENRTVPVSLRVTSQPIAQLSAETISFRIAQGSTAQTSDIAATNRGLGSLTINGASATVASGGAWLSAEKVEGQQLIAVKANPAGLSPGTYQGSVSITSNAAQGNLSVPVQLDVVQPGPPLAYFQGVVNNATYEGGDFLAQGDIVALFGEQFTTGDPKAAASLPLGTELGGTRVYVNDQPAPVYYVSYNQINFQIPYDTPVGDVAIRVEREGQRGNSISASVIASATRLLTIGSSGYGIIVNPDGTLSMPRGPGTNSRPTKVGETVVIYAIGVGPTDPAQTSGAAAPSSPLARARGDYTVSIGFTGPFGAPGSVEVTPMFIGLTPGFVGLYQINATVPQNAVHGASVPVILLTAAGPSNLVTMAVE